jgi:DtxR family Mn-dependent transcriptional regulator
MIHPVNALLIAGLMVIIVLAVFWPGKGLIARWRFLMHQSRRSYLEDALKHIYECERSRIDCTLSSLAGCLSLKKSRVIKLIGRLKKSGLVHIAHGRLVLTEKGRDYALRMLRLHRIWESHLAFETGVPEKDWHAEADVREHNLTPDEVEQISERLGHPRYDPHGEPIPTADGEIPPDRGLLLTELKTDEIGRIIQIEDDPDDIYHEIRENGICLGMQVDSLSQENGSVHFRADGFAKVLPLIVAAQIKITLLDSEDIRRTPFQNLLDLDTGETGRVVQISREFRGQKRRRLLDLGVIPGTVIRKEMESAAGNPIAYNIRGASIALRKDQARFIYIEKIQDR